MRADGGEELALEMATRLSKSVALRLVLGAVRTPLQALDVVMEGSVAQARSKRGRRLSAFLGLGDASLRDRLSGEYLAAAIFVEFFPFIFTFSASISEFGFIVVGT